MCYSLGWSRPCRRRVYPRVGGGNRRRVKADGLGFGLSPRGRGKLKTHVQSLGHKRSIPAWAGET